MPSIEESVNTLKDMGFSEAKARKALNKTGYVEAAMEWLLSNPDDDGEVDAMEEADATPEEGAAAEPPKQPLTEEERQAKIKELEELRIKKRKEREEKEREEEREREKKRMQDGKAITKLRQDLNDAELKKIAEERRREKQEAADAKRRVLEQIEADKRARQMEREAAKAGATATAAPIAVATAAPVEKRNYDEAKIQIKMLDGKKVVQTFKAKEPLSAVRVFVQMTTGNPGPVKLMTSFPPKQFTDEDYEKPLETLGLCPSAVIIIGK